MLPTAATSSLIHRRWTVLSLLEWSTTHLIERGFDEARLQAELLLAHVLACSRLSLYTHVDRPLSDSELLPFNKLLQRRLSREPLQYIVGETEFMGLPLYVSPDVLIPRPETEQLVEQALTAIASLRGLKVDVLDIGTGSGNIAIAIAKRAPRTSVLSLDVSKEALAVARRNIERLAISNITLLHADVFADFLPGRTFDVIISNPPYISLREFEMLQPEVKNFEPRLATTDGADGLRFLHRISAVASAKLNPGGFLFVEVAYNQTHDAKAIVEAAGLSNGRVDADFAGHPRILSAMK